MKQLLAVDINLNGENRQLVVGRPEGREIRDAFRYRYKVYQERGHIDANETGLDIDRCDHQGLCDYFLARIGRQIVGHVRYIKSSPLPTEQFFLFEEPAHISQLDPGKKVEIGRLIATRYHAAMPRHLTLICLIKAMVQFAGENGYQGGYAYLRKYVFDRLMKVAAPVEAVPYSGFDFAQVRKSGENLTGYYFHPEDPVVIISFLYSTFQQWIDYLFDHSDLFASCGEAHYQLKHPLTAA